MKPTVSATPHGLIVRVAEPRLCADKAVGLKDFLLALVDQGSRRMVIDLRSVRSINSSGIAALLIVLKMIGPRGDLALCNMNAKVEKAFKITRMDRVFRVFPNVEAACADAGGIELLKVA